MRILVYGAGVLGSYLAHNLYRGGKDVTLLARGEWAEKIRKNGLIIRHKCRGRSTRDRIEVTERLDPEDRYDLIFVVMQYVHLDAVIPVLRNNCSKTVVFIGNNMSADRYRRELPEKRVLFGFTGVGGRRENERVVCVAFRKSITVGSLDGTTEYRPIIEQVFGGLKYRITYCDRMDDWLKSHVAFILPIAYACYYAGGNLKKIANDKGFLQRIIQATVEGYTALEAAGYEVLPKEDYDYVMQKPKAYYRLLKLMCGTFIGRLAASDHAMSAVPEMRALSRDFDGLIAKSQADMPAWDKLRNYLPEEIQP